MASRTGLGSPLSCPSRALLLGLPLAAITLTAQPMSAAAQASSPKRGLIYISDTPTAAQDSSVWTQAGSDLTWYYNYGPTPTTEYGSGGSASPNSLEFVPMLFGLPTAFGGSYNAQGSSSGQATADNFTAAVQGLVAAGSNLSAVVAFNEPDGSTDTGGSSVPAASAAAAWQALVEPLRSVGVAATASAGAGEGGEGGESKANATIRLGAPAVTSAPSGLAWLADFFAACAGHCSVDFLPLHYYGDAAGLAAYLDSVHAVYPNLTFWLTEYADPNANLSASQAFYNQSVALLDGLDYVERYAYFGSFRSNASNVGPDAAMLDSQGRLTDIGSWYLGRSATGNLPSSALRAASLSALRSLALPALTAAWLLCT